MPALTFGALEWRSAPMPGSNGPVELAQLPALEDGAFRAFVRFPPGWARPDAGHYAMPEEFLVLEGDLTLNGRTWREGGYAWIPARRLRTGSCSTGGCLAFAWFGGTPRWVAGDAATPVRDIDAHLAHWREAPERDLGGGMRVRELRTGSQHTTWLVERPEPDLLLKLGVKREVLRIHDRAWSRNQPVEAGPGHTGPLLVRVQ